MISKLDLIDLYRKKTTPNDRVSFSLSTLNYSPNLTMYCTIKQISPNFKGQKMYTAGNLTNSELKLKINNTYQLSKYLLIFSNGIMLSIIFIFIHIGWINGF